MIVVEGPNWLNCPASDLRYFHTQQRLRRMLATQSKQPSPSRSALEYGDRYVPGSFRPLTRQEAEKINKTSYSRSNSTGAFRPEMLRLIGDLRTQLPTVQEREMKRIEPPEYAGGWNEYGDDSDYDYEFGYEIAA